MARHVFTQSSWLYLYKLEYFHNFSWEFQCFVLHTFWSLVCLFRHCFVVFIASYFLLHWRGCSCALHSAQFLCSLQNPESISKLIHSHTLFLLFWVFLKLFEFVIFYFVLLFRCVPREHTCAVPHEMLWVQCRGCTVGCSPPHSIPFGPLLLNPCVHNIIIFCCAPFLFIFCSFSCCESPSQTVLSGQFNSCARSTIFTFLSRGLFCVLYYRRLQSIIFTFSPGELCVTVLIV